MYISLKVTCIRDPKYHSKVLRLRGMSHSSARIIGAVLTGQSSFYARPVGELSPIGRCALCGGALEYQTMEIDENAKHAKKVRTSRPESMDASPANAGEPARDAHHDPA